MKQISLVIALVALVGCNTPCPKEVRIPADVAKIAAMDLGLEEGQLTLERAKVVQSLNLSVAGLTTVCFLDRFPSLKELRLDSNSIIDISPLANLTNLESLELQLNNVKSLAPLSDLKKLKYLSLRKNKIRSLKPLHQLHFLERLYVFGNPLGKGEISALRKALPSCKIITEEE
ncbi:MAG: hypothetical protein H8E27_02320 [Verrucomicrobia subdivision 3 bacterium]|nr:hypothetical protein [Limisphaerales bacterium]